MQKYSRIDAHNTIKHKHITDMVLPEQPFESGSLVLVDDHNLKIYRYLGSTHTHSDLLHLKMLPHIALLRKLFPKSSLKYQHFRNNIIKIKQKN